MHKGFKCDYDSGSPSASLLQSDVVTIVGSVLGFEIHHPNPFLTFQSDHYLLTVGNIADYCYEAAGVCLQASEELVLALLYKEVSLHGCIICPAATRK